MKYRVYNEDDNEVDKEIYLKLVDDQAGGVKLIAFDKAGTRLHSGSILGIRNGVITLFTGVSTSCGFDLTQAGTVTIVDEREVIE